MADLRTVIVVGDGPVKDQAGLHGRDIGYVWSYGNVQLTCDFALEHDLWVPITNPPTWRDTGKQGWVKRSRLAEDRPDMDQYLVTIYGDGRAPLIRKVG